MPLNNGELAHSREKGDIPFMFRQMVKQGKMDDPISQASPVAALEEVLYNHYMTQLRLAAINLIRPQGTFPKGWGLGDDGWTLLETMIRQGFLIAVGRDGFGKIRILNTQNFASSMGLNAVMGIGFPGDGKIHDDVSDTDLYPIRDDNPDEGDYVIFANKNIAAYLMFFNDGNFGAELNLGGLSDEPLLQTTAQIMATNRATSYQNMIQMRASTVYTAPNKNVTGKLLTERWMNGYPVMGVDPDYDVTQQIQTLQGSPTIATFLPELRAENDYILSNYGMWLGISSSGIQKESGVSDLEAASKLQTTESMAEIYLQARQSPLNKLCHRFGGELTAMFNQQSAKAVLNQMETQAAELVEQRAEAQKAIQEVNAGGNQGTKGE